MSDECQRDLEAYEKAMEAKYMQIATEPPLGYGEDRVCLDQDSYTLAPCCLNCEHNDVCGCGEFGDKGICLLYKEQEAER